MGRSGNRRTEIIKKKYSFMKSFMRLFSENRQGSWQGNYVRESHVPYAAAEYTLIRQKLRRKLRNRIRYKERSCSGNGQKKRERMPRDFFRKVPRNIKKVLEVSDRKEAVCLEKDFNRERKRGENRHLLLWTRQKIR